MEYEELPLFIHPDFREVIVHKDGHKPPLLKKDQPEFWRLARFLDAMEKGNVFTPTDHEDNGVRRSLWLPVQRGLASEPPAGKRQLLVVPDPLGAGPDLHRVMDALQAMQAKGEALEFKGEPFVSSGSPPKPIQRLALLMELCQASHEVFSKDGSDLDVQHVTFTEDQKINWHCQASEVPSRQLLSKDIVQDEEHDLRVRALATKLLESIKVSGGPGPALVGFASGAFIAFAMARELVATGVKPLGLWLVNPPLRLPWSMTATPCCLKDCPVQVLVDQDSTYGPPWRYEVATFGPFSTAVYVDLNDMASKVVSALRGS